MSSAPVWLWLLLIFGTPCALAFWAMIALARAQARDFARLIRSRH